MTKKYSDRAMESEPKETAKVVEVSYVFPKQNKVIKATSRKEAEKELKANQK